MPAISRPLNHGRAEVDVELNVPQAVAQNLQASGLPVPPFQQAVALIDSGASATCVHAGLVQALQLIAVGARHVRTPTTGPNPITVPTYRLDLTVLHPRGKHLVVPVLEVIEAQFINMGHLVLIGTDVLAGCVFSYNGPGQRFRLRY
jgi:hypothetical protein